MSAAQPLPRKRRSRNGNMNPLLYHSLPNGRVFRGVDDVLALGRQDSLDLFLGSVDAIRVHRMSGHEADPDAGLRLPKCLHFLDDTDRAGRVIPGGVEGLNTKANARALGAATELQEGRLGSHPDATARGVPAESAAEEDAAGSPGNSGDLALGRLAGHVAGGYVGNLVGDRAGQLRLLAGQLDKSRVYKDKSAGEREGVGDVVLHDTEG